MKIGMMDSGVGGLTVLKECLSRLPAHEYLYYADSNHAPYGTKSSTDVYELTETAVDDLVKRGAEIIVIACNTATSVAAAQLRKKYDIPIIGMEPAIKPALQLANQKRVLVVATELTLHLEKFRDLIEVLDVKQQVDFVPLTELVEFAETGNFNRAVIMPYLKSKLAHVNLEHYGSVVLGCTHFPFFRRYFEDIFPVGTAIVDGAVGTANRVKAFVTSQSKEPSILFLLSGEPLIAGEFFELMQSLIK